MYIYIYIYINWYMYELHAWGGYHPCLGGLPPSSPHPTHVTTIAKTRTETRTSKNCATLSESTSHILEQL